ncbi:unnamed protein product [Ilex paraguariensis]|uniref:C2 domain-containing protein n=1 Tax=Ilex paraguariensis TaxID=185542 RepID=A0ABC8UC99_9AQUA
MIIDTALEFLVPSWWEVQVTIAASLFVIAAYWFFTYDVVVDRPVNDHSEDPVTGDIIDKYKIGQLKGDSQTNSAFIIKVELLAAKNLIGANLNGTSDPYAIITCGAEKRFR